MKTIFQSHLFKALLPVAVLLAIVVPMWINGYKIHEAKASVMDPEPPVSATQPIQVFKMSTNEVYQYVTTERRSGIKVKLICNVAFNTNSSANIAVSCVEVE